jgi:hypothetical protein
MLGAVAPSVEFEIPDVGNEIGPKEVTINGMCYATNGNDQLFLGEASATASDRRRPAGDGPRPAISIRQKGKTHGLQDPLPPSSRTSGPRTTWCPGNEQADNPVEFDLAPAWGAGPGPDQVHRPGSMGLVQDQDWSPAVQQAVVAALETGQSAFVNTVEAVRGLTMPAAMALRAGLIPALPLMPGTANPDPRRRSRCTDGLRVQPDLRRGAGDGVHVALKIAEISAKSEVDPRFFVQPSGSGGTGTPEATASTAGSAQPRPEGAELRAKVEGRRSRPRPARCTPGTSRPSRSPSEAGAGGKVAKRIEHRGGVFAPVPGKGQRPAYTCGPKTARDGDQSDTLLFQCPVSAIPSEVWDLLHLWWACRQMGLPPVAGGFLDQPKMVQLSFPIFEALMKGVEAGQRAGGRHQAAGLAVAG